MPRDRHAGGAGLFSPYGTARFLATCCPSAALADQGEDPHSPAPERPWFHHLFRPARIPTFPSRASLEIRKIPLSFDSLNFSATSSGPTFSLPSR